VLKKTRYEEVKEGKQKKEGEIFTPEGKKASFFDRALSHGEKSLSLSEGKKNE